LPGITSIMTISNLSVSIPSTADSNSSSDAMVENQLQSRRQACFVHHAPGREALNRSAVLCGTVTCKINEERIFRLCCFEFYQSRRASAVEIAYRQVASMLLVCLL
jgi:hypothetical protein